MKRKFLPILALLILLLTITGCPLIPQVEPEPEQYVLTINLDGVGEVTPASGTKYDPDTLVTLTPSSTDSKWVFEKWAGTNAADIVNNQITMTSDKTITAVFKELHYYLNMSIEGNGSVLQSYIDGTLAPTNAGYDENDQVYLTAQADSGWTFSHWSGDLTGTENPSLIVMDNEKNITAHFISVQNQNVNGVVLDLETMHGISGAIVEVSSENNTYLQQLTTGTDGSFDATLPQGSYTFVATAVGYVNNTAHNVQIVDITNSSELVNVSFALPPEGEEMDYCSITGKVTDNNGNPLTNALITVDGGEQTNGIFISKQTDAYGNYFVYGIPLTDTFGNPLIEVQISASKDDYLSQEQAITLIANETISHVDFALIPGTYEETVYFEDDFETNQNWDPTGFWHLQQDAVIYNTAVPTYVTLPPDDTSNAYIPYAYSGQNCYWYGQESTGNFIGTQMTGDDDLSGGTSTQANQGALYSPMIDLSNATDPILSFMTWYEIESVNPNEYGFDLMTVKIYKQGESTADLLRLNPYADPIASDREPLAYTSGGFNQAAHWIPIKLDLSEYAGAKIQIIFVFETKDDLYNGFRGWFIDDVKVADISELSYLKDDILQIQTYDDVETTR